MVMGIKGSRSTGRPSKWARTLSRLVIDAMRSGRLLGSGAQAPGHGGDELRACAATAADKTGAGRHQFRNVTGKLIGGHTIMRLALDHGRQTGICFDPD